MMQSSKDIASLFLQSKFRFIESMMQSNYCTHFLKEFKLVKPSYCIITIFKQDSTCFKDDTIIPKKAMIGIIFVPFYLMFDFIAKI